MQRPPDPASAGIGIGSPWAEPAAWHQPALGVIPWIAACAVNALWASCRSYRKLAEEPHEVLVYE
jgi:hypothetical protein